MSTCGTCPSCSTGVPICVGNICIAPEEAVVSSGFLVAGFVAVFNFFVAQRDAVKTRLSNSRRFVLFGAIPMIAAILAVQHGYLEIPTWAAIQNSVGLSSPKPAEPAPSGHGHTHGHASWHGDHTGHFHNLATEHLQKEL